MNAKEVCYNTHIIVKVGGTEVYHYEVKNAPDPTDMRPLLRSIVEKYNHKTEKTVFISAKSEKVVTVYNSSMYHSKSYYYAPDETWYFSFFESGRAYASKEKIFYFSHHDCFTCKDGTHYFPSKSTYKKEEVYEKQWNLR